MNKEQTEIIINSAEEMRKTGRNLAKEIIKGNSGGKQAVIIGLEGNLGSGKTTFIQGMAKGLGIKDKIASPTFVIMKRYFFRKRCFYHIDCYRIKAKDLLELDFQEIINQANNIIVIEWAERVKELLPQGAFWMKFEHIAQNKRRIIINENFSFN